MNYRSILLALAMLATALQSQAAGSAASLISEAAQMLGPRASNSEPEYGPDGKLTLAAAKKIMQGRSPYDLKVYMYIIADRTDEIDWDGGASKALNSQIERCRGAQQNFMVGRRQLEAQERELTGDAYIVADQRSRLAQAEYTLRSQWTYECRAVEQAQELRNKSTTRGRSANPLKD